MKSDLGGLWRVRTVEVERGVVLRCRDRGRSKVETVDFVALERWGGIEPFATGRVVAKLRLSKIVENS